MLTYAFVLLQQMKADRKGVTALEYGVIASLMVVMLSVAVPPMAAALSGSFGTVAAAL